MCGFLFRKHHNEVQQGRQHVLISFVVTRLDFFGLVVKHRKPQKPAAVPQVEQPSTNLRFGGSIPRLATRRSMQVSEGEWYEIGF